MGVVVVPGLDYHVQYSGPCNSCLGHSKKTDDDDVMTVRML